MHLQPMAHDANVEIQRRQQYTMAALTYAFKPIISWFVQSGPFAATTTKALHVSSSTSAVNSDVPGCNVRCRQKSSGYHQKQKHHHTPSVDDGFVDSNWRTVEFCELPEWLQDNHFLLSGHRPQLSFKETLKSLFRIHSETVNIWTHFGGFFVYLVVLIHFLLDVSGITWSDKKWISFSMIGYLATLLFSAMFHLLHCYSPAFFRWCIRFDYIGIHVASICLCMSWMHYTFQCQQHIELMYVAAVWLAAPFCTAVGLFERFAHPELRSLRAAALGALGAIGHMGAIHYTTWYVTFDQMMTEGVHFVYLAAITMYIGGFLFAVQFPECCKPGRFDIWGSSHQLLHVCVLFAGYFHFTGLKQIALYRLSRGCTFFGEQLVVTA